MVDEKLIFISDFISSRNNNFELIHFNPSIHSFLDLLSLVYSSGQKSRFKIDSNFRNKEFEKLYEKWINNSIDQNNSSTILIKIVDNKLAGFLSYSLNGLFIKIELIAVDKDYQGMGIGTQLIEQLVKLAEINGKISIEVATQASNFSAIKLYEKNNFSLQSSSYIYHYWKQ